MKKPTLFLGLCGGPGCGKSTMAAAIFAELKFYGIDCEYVDEFAKSLIWEKRYKTFENQIYLFGKQHHKIYRLDGEVDIAITDCPILLTPIYDQEERKLLKALVLEEYNKHSNYTIFLNRKKKYNPNGRNQTEKEAVVIDNKIKKFLKDNHIQFQELEGTKENVQHIVRVVIEQLGISNSF